MSETFITEAIEGAEIITLQWVVTILKKYPTHIVIPELEKRIKELQK